MTCSDNGHRHSPAWLFQIQYKGGRRVGAVAFDVPKRVGLNHPVDHVLGVRAGPLAGATEVLPALRVTVRGPAIMT